MTATAAAAEDIRELLGVEPPLESVKWLNLLVYGEPGAGKTYLGGTAQDHVDTKPMLILDVEGGVMTLRHRQDVDVLQVRTMKQVQDTINTLAKQPKPYYKTLFLDSLTELQKLDMRTVMKQQYDKKPETTDIYVPSQREWGKSGERVRMIVRALRDLECHVIMTALMAEDKDDQTGKRLIHPSMPGKLKSEIPGFFDIVGLLRAVNKGGDDGITRTLQVVKTERLIAKDRTAMLPGLIDDPSIPLIWDLIHNSKSNSKVNSK